MTNKKKILVTGSDGFVAKNFIVKLNEESNYKLLLFNRNNSLQDLNELVSNSDFMVHLAGENRPSDEKFFIEVNKDLTKKICDFARSENRNIPIIYFSSAQAVLENPYGKSKAAGEKEILSYSRDTKSDCLIYRPPGIFGKWSKPNYNSVVATFCYNIANNKEIFIDNLETEIKLVYVDDIVESLIKSLSGIKRGCNYKEISPIYEITLGELAKKIKLFRDSRESLITERVGKGIDRALYSTYLSFLPKEDFSYNIKSHDDNRGSFVEMMKTQDSGQFSFFTAFPGITRGGHYHHTKSEKFLIIQGTAKYRFKNVVTKEYFEINTCADEKLIVETIPGWSHDITNTGPNTLIVMLWANENFDPNKPDTIQSEVKDEKT